VRFFFMLENYLVTGMSSLQRDALAELILAQPTLIDDLFRLVRSGTRVQRMKGAWVLSGIQSKNSSVLQPYLVQIMQCVKTESVGGVKRELLRCINPLNLTTDMNDQLTILMLDWVTDDQQDFAVRYLSYRLLKPLLSDFPELQSELQERILLFKSKFGRFP